MGSAPALPQDLSQISVLLVDDSLYMRRLLRSLLQGLGVRHVLEAEDGASALEVFQQQPVDIIITDWVMPVFDGLELTAAVRNPETSDNPYTPIIMLSAYTERSRVIQARDAGVTEFLCKPISAKQLYLRLENCIVKPRPFIRTQRFFGPDRRRFVHPNYVGEKKRQDDTDEDEEFQEIDDAVET
ncbi:MAG: response regulator [Rhizobiales bacterium]|nr:response regulator [Hyphomicrobiales bacterium]MBO6697842.1 response regulator [Hyphomicrobiales bacterium]MBO6735903.1 response regulator [Hyphomicrobiales bacterium]MBO6912373.1 response regulator [Hyphomicrobiales bacterium]MBO6955003.1 response regulator [Hyphomicrobiales bacterium]